MTSKKDNGRGWLADSFVQRIQQITKKLDVSADLTPNLSRSDLTRMATELVTKHADAFGRILLAPSNASSAKIRRVYTHDDFRKIVARLLIPEYQFQPIIDAVTRILHDAYKDTR